MSAESLPADRLIGEVLAHRYEILHRLGEGAMGAVYKARHVKVGRSFAVKVLHARVLQDTKVLKRFEREAELAGRLRHANVVGVVDVGEIDDMRYMVMDYAEGPDLAQLLDEAPMPPVRIIHLVRQLLEGLYHAHEQGLIHRDFKPENVIVERDSHGAELPRIVDFGIAILRDGGTGTDQQGRLTTNGLVLGTPHYMAPEQAVADPIDHRIDLFALGIVVYEMLSGRLPYDGNGAEVARANLLLDPPPIIQRVPYLEVDPLLEAFARRLMAKKRDARPPTAKAARELLDLIERDRPAAAAALGLSPSMSMRGPAVTEPVHPQGQAASPGSAPPERLPSWLSDQATTSMRSPGVAGPVRGDAPPIAVVNAARAAVDPRAPISQREVETSRRVPLGWENASPPHRRTPWFVGASVLGIAGIVLAVALTRSASDEPTDTRVVMTPIESPTNAAGTHVAGAKPAGGDADPNAAGAATPTRGSTGAPMDRSADPARSNASPSAALPVEPSTADSAAAPRATDPIVASDGRGNDANAATRAPTRDVRDSTQRGPKGGTKTSDAKVPASRASAGASTKVGEARSGDARSGDARSGDARSGDARSGDARSGDARTGSARTAEIRSGEARSGDARSGDARSSDVRTASAQPDAKGGSTSSDATRAAGPGETKAGGATAAAAVKTEPRAGDARAGDARTGSAKPAAKLPKVNGLTANELSDFYSSVGRELSALPSSSAQDLWSRLLLIKIQELMAAPQAKRDEAARQLLLIHQEAVLRKP